MFFGVHLLLYSRDPEADRGFLRDVLGMESVDAGHGWLIFALPPAEMAVHPDENVHGASEGSDGPATGTVYLMCRDLKATMAELAAKGVTCGPVQEARWGSLSSIPLPGGSSVGLYEPHHPLAINSGHT